MLFALLAAPVCFVPAPRLPAHGVAAPASAHVRMGVDPETKLWTPDDILWTPSERSGCVSILRRNESFCAQS